MLCYYQEEGAIFPKFLEDQSQIIRDISWNFSGFSVVFLYPGKSNTKYEDPICCPIHSSETLFAIAGNIAWLGTSVLILHFVQVDIFPYLVSAHQP